MITLHYAIHQTQEIYIKQFRSLIIQVQNIYIYILQIRLIKKAATPGTKYAAFHHITDGKQKKKSIPLKALRVTYSQII